MIWNYFLLFVLIFIVPIESVKLHNSRTASFSGKLKRHIDLQVYTKLTDVEEKEESDSGVIYVCDDEENGEKLCTCEDETLTCTSLLTDANIKPLKEGFVIKIAALYLNNITFIKKDKLLPDNENTVEELNLDANGIKEIEPGSFDKFSAMTSLDLHSNLLQTLDPEIFSSSLGKTLKTLNLGHNKITTINLAAFQNLENLETLSLYRNFQVSKELVGEFPEGLKNLKVLDLSNCGLIRLDGNLFIHLKGLSTIKISHNAFPSIPAAINLLSNLKTFEFIGSTIETIHKNSFEFNEKLRIISMAFSLKLQSIEDCAFCNLRRLKAVSLWFSRQLSFIHENAFGAISYGSPPRLTMFSVENANITILPERMLNYKKIWHLALGGNPFACNCSMAWLFKDLLSEDSVFEKRLASGFMSSSKKSKHIHKYSLGCLGPAPATPQPTHPPSVLEIFEHCQLYSDSNYLWYFLVFFFFIAVIAASGIYAYRTRLFAHMSFVNEDEEEIL